MQFYNNDFTIELLKSYADELKPNLYNSENRSDRKIGPK